jgi:glutaredoxin
MSDKSDIIVYGAPWCAFCHTAMHYLDQLKVKYKYIDVDQDPKAGMEAVEKSGQRGIPFDRPRIDASLKQHQLT